MGGGSGVSWVLAPAVAEMLGRPGVPSSEMLRKFLRYGEALLSPDPAALDLVVEPGARMHDLEAMGLPPGCPGSSSSGR